MSSSKVLPSRLPTCPRIMLINSKMREGVRPARGVLWVMSTPLAASESTSLPYVSARMV